eukprot:2313432-Rhodomonas_salina.1
MACVRDGVRRSKFRRGQLQRVPSISARRCRHRCVRIERGEGGEGEALTHCRPARAARVSGGCTRVYTSPKA